jgi:hypothetical protein
MTLPVAELYSADGQDNLWTMDSLECKSGRGVIWSKITTIVAGWWSDWLPQKALFTIADTGVETWTPDCLNMKHMSYPFDRENR